MASQIEIANRALTKLGEARITTLDEDSKAAETLFSMYDIVLESELRANVWNFAKTRARLPALSIDPVFGFSQQFQLPADFLRLIQVGEFNAYPATRDTRGLYSLEGRALLTDLPAPLAVRYIRRMTDATQYDSLFVEVLACRLAWECAMPITQVVSNKQTAMQEYQLAVRAAIRANAIERPSQAIADDTWMEAHVR
ncbi:hypothetical protein [Chitinasiproducens palmae]|uniref:Uncharacterized protein n=1 Tax=Chitinasiproducens palmae TaxID=1770053 RepID=A0A1H2PQT1_9BURK|nr:hypothetical protein [Chitinasiproducens palmae]SDV49192.1 hypothetical protein SAMN05216551_107141 [Chitinasiproducens palmae]